MPKLQLSAFEPIEIAFTDGKGGEDVYKIKSISSQLLADLATSAKEYEDNPENVKSEEFAELLMRTIPGMTKDKAMLVDIRHIVMIVKFLGQQITDAAKPPAGEEKNA